MKTQLSGLALLFSLGCNTASKPAAPPAAAPVCGDKQLGAGEQCDDGNTLDGDGCSKTCQKETAAASAPTTTAQSQPTPEPAGASIFYDGRRRVLSPPLLRDIVDAPKLPSELEKKILGQILPRYTRAGEDCADPNGAILGVGYSAAGSFTAAGAKETAYLVTRRPCDASLSLFEASELGPSMYLSIFEGEAFVASFNGKTMTSGGETNDFTGEKIEGVLDVDQDGINELVVTSSGFGQGTEVVLARLYRFEGKRSTELAPESEVYTDSCAGGLEPRIEAAVLSYEPVKRGEPLCVSTETYLAPCKDKYELADFVKAPSED